MKNKIIKLPVFITESLKRIKLPLAAAILVLLVFSCRLMPFKKESFEVVEYSVNDYSTQANMAEDIGRVYKYRKSNSDGSKAAGVWVYVKSESRTESFKIYGENSLYLVTAEYDLESFFTTELLSHSLKKDGTQSLEGEMVSDNGETYHTSVGSSTYQVEVGHVPSYNYNFDWVDLSFMHRHLINKTKDFTTGIIVPDGSFAMVYGGKVLFEYMGIIDKNNHSCHQYKISGNAFNDETGYLYTDVESGICVEIDMPVQNTGGFNSFLFSLEEEFDLSSDEWDKFIKEKTNELL